MVAVDVPRSRLRWVSPVPVMITWSIVVMATETPKSMVRLALAATVPLFCICA